MGNDLGIRNYRIYIKLYGDIYDWKFLDWRASEIKADDEYFEHWRGLPSEKEIDEEIRKDKRYMETFVKLNKVNFEYIKIFGNGEDVVKELKNYELIREII